MEIKNRIKDENEKFVNYWKAEQCEVPQKRGGQGLGSR